jgi:putative ABC transport system ATP-binding protein
MSTGSWAGHSKVIRAKGLGKVYPEGATELRALAGVDLEVRAGELTLLMGPSGSGKTTLLSILGCILRPSEGPLELLGENVSLLAESELPRIRREAIGFVFQGFHLFPELDATENVALALDVRGMRGSTSRLSTRKRGKKTRRGRKQRWSWLEQSFWRRALISRRATFARRSEE